MTPLPLPLLTHSALSAARACLRLYRNRYVLGVRSLRQPPETADFGDLVHKGLEAWWSFAPCPTDEYLPLRMALLAMRSRKNTDPYQLARAQALLIGYHARWIDTAGQIHVLAVEQEFRAPLTNPDTGSESKTFRIGGKIDAVAQQGARVLTVEHKTSSEDISAGSFYWMRLQMDSQVSIYFDGGRALGHDVQGCLYDVIGKPELRPSQVPVLDDQGEKVVHDAAGQRVRTKDGKKWRQTGDTAAGYVLQTRPETPAEYRARIIDKLCEDPERYYQRGEIARDGTDLVDAARDRWQLATALRDAIRMDRWPRNPSACMNYGRPCEYLEACAGRADLADPFLFCRAETAHPELAPDEPASEPSREETAA